ncbi:MAG: universal stress protein [Chloroflexi bacterium]|nr:universal stress protein [Chloroflexota bacterium]
MYQRILVPLDGSTLSEAVLPHAEKLARALNVEIVLLHVDVSPAPTFDPHESPLEPQPEEVKIMHADEKHYLKTMCSKLESEGLRATYLLRDGMVADTILETAEIEQADLIAMSTHGRTGMLRLLLGSVAEQVVHRSKIPVVLIRPIGE